MKIEKLCYFLSVAKHRNFTKAAKECHIAQPAISKQMLALEKELGFLLFERKNRRVDLTDAGVSFQQSVSCLIEEYEAAVERVRQYDEKSAQPLPQGVLTADGQEGGCGIEKLDYFVSAASHRNFTKAAKECGVAQSAISQQIASLEELLDRSLFRRHGRSVDLTPEGELFYHDARRLQLLYQQAVQKARSAARQLEEQQLTIGIPGLQSAAVLREKFSQWKKDFPTVEVKLQRYSPEYCRRELNQQLYDAILCYWVPQDEEKGYAYEELGRKPLRVFLSEKDTLTGQSGLSFQQILEQADKLYMSYDVWTQLNSMELLNGLEKEKIKCFHDADMLLPMGSINQAVVLTTDVPRDTAEDMKEYSLPENGPELREILLFRRQNRSRLLQNLCGE